MTGDDVMQDRPMFAAPEGQPVALVHGRECGTCTLCCKLLRIPELDKAQGIWCAHCAPRRGCKIYESRPTSCREFFCGYMTSKAITDVWKPSHSRIVLMGVDGGISAVVDRDRPEAWQGAPYYDQLKAWARQGMDEGWFVTVRVDTRITAVLPDRDMGLGAMEPGEGIQVGWHSGPAGMVYEAKKLPPP